ncbi:MAG: polyprenyl synthetase family protein [Opitutales bacterium]
MLATTESPTRPRDANVFADVFAPARGHLDALDRYLAQQVEAFEPEVRPHASFCLQHQGKRLRPMLVFLSGWTRDGSVSKDLVQGAAVVELVHLATLVHDDILDEADVRHNAPTVAARHGPNVAVLLGDAFFAHALHLAAQFPTPEVCRLVSRATRQVCTGEIFQTLNRGARVTRADYYRAIELKTAELFAVSCQVGALLGGHAPVFQEAASDFGRALGTAYQIFDDLVDYLGSTDQIGKTLGTDLAGGKYTLPLIALLDRLEPRQRAIILDELASDAGPSEFQLRRLAGWMREYDIVRVVRDAFDHQLALAHDALAPFAGHPAAERLEHLSSAVESYMDRV